VSLDIWETCTLGDFVRLQRGHDLPSGERIAGNIPILGSAGITGYHNKALASGPGITIGRSGNSMGEISYSPVDFWPHNTTLYVTDFLGNHPKFAFYYLRTIDFHRYNSGSAQPSLNRNQIYSLRITLPDVATQRRIADILGSLDDKIELNRRTNETLEAMARTLFRSWFVDFDPVRAKADSQKPQGMDAATVKLFPNSFSPSEAGSIPKGWNASTFGSIAKLLSGGTPSKANPTFWNGDIPWLSAKDMKTPRILDTEDHVTADGAENGTRLVEAGTTLILVRGMTLHNDVPICMAARSLTFNQDVKAAVSENPEFREYVFLWLLENKPALMGLVDSASHGTGRIHTDLLAKQIMVVPPADLLARFNAIVRPLLERATVNDRESVQLAAVRDALLPRLLSGEVRVRASAGAIEEVVA